MVNATYLRLNFNRRQMCYRTFLHLALVVALTASCAFNSRFHYPSKIPVSIESLKSFDFGKDTVLFNLNPQDKTIHFSRKDGEPIDKDFMIRVDTIKSKSGNVLNAWLMTPTTINPKATVVHFHGSAGNLFTQYKAISPLLNYGYRVLTFDYSGYGFSSGKATRKNALKDAYSILDYVKGKDELRHGEIILYGQSYGGYLASVIGSNRQNEIDAIVVEGAFASHRDEARYTVPFWGSLVKNEEKADVEIKKNWKPVLVIHSKEDKKVPIEFGKIIFENANHPKQFYEIDQSHILGLQYYAEEIAEKIHQLLNSK